MKGVPVLWVWQMSGRMYHIDTMPVYYVEFSSVSGSQNKRAIGVCMNWVATLRSPHRPWYVQRQQQ